MSKYLVFLLVNEYNFIQSSFHKSTWQYGPFFWLPHNAQNLMLIAMALSLLVQHKEEFIGWSFNK